MGEVEDGVSSHSEVAVEVEVTWMTGISFAAIVWNDLHLVGARETVRGMSATIEDLRDEKTIEDHPIGQSENVIEMETESAEINLRQDLTIGPRMSPSTVRIHLIKLLKHPLSILSDWP